MDKGNSKRDETKREKKDWATPEVTAHEVEQITEGTFNPSGADGFVYS